MQVDRWKHLLDDHHMPPWQMDWRHICMVNAVIERLKPASLVEIGTYRGAGTSAVIEAIEHTGFPQRVLLVDYDMKFDRRSVEHLPGRFFYSYDNSAHLTGCHADMWIIDGDHDKYAMGDLETAKKGGAKIIVAHDTHTAKFAPGHDGAAKVADALLNEWTTWADAGDRNGEWTHRGIMFAFSGIDRKDVADTMEILSKLAL